MIIKNGFCNVGLYVAYNREKIKKGTIVSKMYNYFDNVNEPWHNTDIHQDNQQLRSTIPSMDYGPNPFIVDIKKSTKHNNNYRTALWTGNHLQLTLMNIPVGQDIGLEVHPNTDQFLRIEEGHGLAQMGDRKDHLYLQQPVFDDSAIFVPAGTWHNVINVGNKPLKLYSIYAPPKHPWGKVQQTKEIAQEENGNKR